MLFEQLKTVLTAICHSYTTAHPDKVECKEAYDKIVEICSRGLTQERFITAVKEEIIPLAKSADHLFSGCSLDKQLLAIITDLKNPQSDLIRSAQHMEDAISREVERRSVAMSVVSNGRFFQNKERSIAEYQKDPNAFLIMILQSGKFSVAEKELILNIKEIMEAEILQDDKQKIQLIQTKLIINGFVSQPKLAIVIVEEFLSSMTGEVGTVSGEICLQKLDQAIAKFKQRYLASDDVKIKYSCEAAMHDIARNCSKISNMLKQIGVNPKLMISEVNDTILADNSGYWQSVQKAKQSKKKSLSAITEDDAASIKSLISMRNHKRKRGGEEDTIVEEEKEEKKESHSDDMQITPSKKSHTTLTKQ